MRRLVIATLIGLCWAASGAGLAAAKDPPHLFGTRETRSEDLSVFPKWRTALGRAAAEAAAMAVRCEPGPFESCEMAEWMAFLKDLRGVRRRDQIDAVNRFMNRHPYLLDPVNYGVPDYWAAPGEFFARDGDCEDYAIAKFLSLRSLGFANDSLRVVVLHDTHLGIAHAVLAVYLGDEILILDNQVEDVVPASAIRHYRPIYSINETAWWLHRS